MENEELKKMFANVKGKYKDIENTRKEVMKQTVDLKGSPTHRAINGMYESPEVGTMSDETVCVYTSTVFIENFDSNKETLSNDVVMLRASNQEGGEIHVSLSRADCIELIRHISTAASLLRGD